MNKFFCILTALVLSVFASGCSSAHRWQVVEISGTYGTNSAHIFYRPVLLDTRTGRTWIYTWEARKTFWTMLPMTNAPETAGAAATQASEAIKVGQTAAFTVTATGTTPLFYQWYKSGTNISGNSEQTTILTNVQPETAIPK